MTCSNPRFLQASQRHVHTKPGSTPPKWKAPCRTVLREFIAGVEQLRRTSTWIEVNPLKVSGKNHGSLSARNRVNLEVVELQIKLCLSAWGSISNFPLSMPCISAILCRASARSRLHCEFFEPGWGGSSWWDLQTRSSPPVSHCCYRFKHDATYFYLKYPRKRAQTQIQNKQTFMHQLVLACPSGMAWPWFTTQLATGVARLHHCALALHSDQACRCISSKVASISRASAGAKGSLAWRWLTVWL